MKNTLVKYMDYELSDQDPHVDLFSQEGQIVQDLENDMEGLSVQTPLSVDQEAQNMTSKAFKDNLHLLCFHDDSSYINFTLTSLKKKGVNLTLFPQNYDLNSIIPFLLLNDHSILVVKNPKADVLPLLKNIMRHGIIWYKPPGTQGVNLKPIIVNLTVWVFFDILPWLGKFQKLNKNLK